MARAGADGAATDVMMAYSAIRARRSGIRIMCRGGICGGGGGVSGVDGRRGFGSGSRPWHGAVEHTQNVDPRQIGCHDTHCRWDWHTGNGPTVMPRAASHPRLSFQGSARDLASVRHCRGFPTNQARRRRISGVEPLDDTEKVGVGRHASGAGRLPMPVLEKLLSCSALGPPQATGDIAIHLGHSQLRIGPRRAVDLRPSMETLRCT